VTAPTRSASSAAKTVPATMAEAASVRGDSERQDQLLLWRPALTATTNLKETK
jgi:hypothetical protein